MPLHPTRYAEMLSKKMQDAEVNVWLVNTGWTGGPYGVGSRMKLKYTREMISSALEGELDKVEYHTHPIFGLEMPKECLNVPNEVLDPRETWKDKEAYDIKAKELALFFKNNFKKFEDNASEDILKGGPLV